MGHKDLKTTMKHYAKPIEETADKNRFMMSELAVLIFFVINYRHFAFPFNPYLFI